MFNVNDGWKVLASVKADPGWNVVLIDVIWDGDPLQAVDTSIECTGIALWLTVQNKHGEIFVTPCFPHGFDRPAYKDGMTSGDAENVHDILSPDQIFLERRYTERRQEILEETWKRELKRKEKKEGKG